MKITDHIKKANGKTLFSFEVIPPKKGNNIQELYDNINPLMEFKPPFIDVTTSREEFVYIHKENGLLDRKKEIFSRYKEKLEPFGIEFIKTEKDTNNSYWLIVVIFKSHKINIDILREYLYANNIETKKIFYPLERQTMYKNSKNNKNSYDVYSRSLCLPSSPDLSDNQVDFISEKLIKYLINV